MRGVLDDHERRSGMKRGIGGGMREHGNVGESGRLGNPDVRMVPRGGVLRLNVVDDAP
jgi:hypothetical protein